MKTKRSLLRTALFASAALSPLLVSHETMAQGAPGAGAFPGSFLVPGTQTSFKIGGYVKLASAYPFGAQQTNASGTALPALLQAIGPCACWALSIASVTIPILRDTGEPITRKSPC